MEAALTQLQFECSTAEYDSAVKLLNTYIKNIYQNNSVEKYRKIRTGNEKFHSNVWRHEHCRTLLLLSGFEELDKFIVLPSNIDISVFYDLLQKQLVNANPASQSVPAPSPVQQTTTLKLGAASQSGGLFVQDLQADLTLLSYMVEMGYSKHAAEKGLIATKNQGVQPAMDWIALHPECHLVEEKRSVPVMPEAPAAAASTSSTSQEVKTNITSRLRNANEQKHIYQEKLRLENIKKAKLEKAEDQILKQNMYKNMECERQVTKEKFEREKMNRHVESEQQGTAAGVVGADTAHDTTACVVRIRLYTGQTSIWETDQTARVKDLCNHAMSLVNESDEEFLVCVPHPHEVLDRNDESLLHDKGLSRATVVVRKANETQLVEGEGIIIPAEVTQPTIQDGSDETMNPEEVTEPTTQEYSDETMNSAEEEEEEETCT